MIHVISELLGRLREAGGPEALVQQTLAAHGLAAAAAPAPSFDGKGPAADWIEQVRPDADGMTRHRTVTPHGTREWLMKRADKPAARPALVVMLHGCGQTAADFARGTGMNEAATAQGWHVIWPEQPGEANHLRCWNWFEPEHQSPGAGEPEILTAVIAHALEGLGIEDADIFVAGHSAGGAMAAVLAETHPGLLRAVGIHSGVPVGAAASSMAALSAMRNGGAAPVVAGDVPMIVFHGSADPIVSPTNGDALANHISGTTYHETGDGRAWVIRKGPAGEYWRIEGLAHAWSGGRPGSSNTDPSGPDATAEMVRFFAEQRR